MSEDEVRDPNEVSPDEWHPTSATVTRTFGVMMIVFAGVIAGIIVLALIS